MGSGIPIPYSPLFQFVLLSDQRGGGGGEGGGMAPFALLRYANDSGVGRISQRGPSEGAKRPSRERVHVDGREIFGILCIKNGIFAH